jgi:hypothetical protein
MTEDQYLKAQDIKDQIRNCRTMIEYIECSSSFNIPRPGMKSILIKEYEEPINWFMRRINQLNKDLEKI